MLDELAPVPYDLTGILGGRGEQATRRLACWSASWSAPRRLRARSGWASTSGAQRPREAGARAASYVGRRSRAQFPLTPEFAAGSTNSTVGPHGRAPAIDDVQRHIESGGAFYVCDNEVRPEACLPLVDETRSVLGIVDAEPRPGAFFGPKRLARPGGPRDRRAGRAAVRRRSPPGR